MTFQVMLSLSQDRKGVPCGCLFYLKQANRSYSTLILISFFLASAFECFQFFGCSLQGFQLFWKTEADLRRSEGGAAIETASRHSGNPDLLDQVESKLHIILETKMAHIGHDIVGPIRPVDTKSSLLQNGHEEVSSLSILFSQ